ILSAAMLLETSFGLTEEANAIRKACTNAVENKKYTPDLANPGQSCLTTQQVGDYIAGIV
ncbi:MAG: 3-isopropylmalate dehydrogenase, partial [Bacteroidales bacterium]|nr:3-isopropylmalate dehydrogenase [Bacteroidales bacterium]